MRLIRWVEGRLSGRRQKQTEPSACRPADQDFIFHPSPFRKTCTTPLLQRRETSPQLDAKVQRRLSRQLSFRMQLDGHAYEDESNQGNSKFRPLSNTSGNLRRSPDFYTSSTRRALSSSETYSITPPLPVRPEWLKKNTKSCISSSSFDTSCPASSSKLPPPPPPPWSTPISRPLPATPIVQPYERKQHQHNWKISDKQLDRKLINSFYSPAHLIQGSILQQKLKELEDHEKRKRACEASSESADRKLKMKLLKANACKETSLNDFWTTGIKMNQHLHWKEQPKKVEDLLSFPYDHSNASSNQSQALLSSMQSSLSQADSMTETRQSLQSSISIDSGCPLTCGSSLMESSMQSSLMSDSLYLLDNRITLERMKEFHDSQLDLQQIRSMEVNDLYDQVPAVEEKEANDGDNEEEEEDEAEEEEDEDEEEEEEEEELLVVDAYGGVHQFSQPMHSSDSKKQMKNNQSSTVASFDSTHGCRKVLQPHLIPLSVDKIVSPVANASATYRISRCTNKLSDKNLLLQRRESGYESSTVAPSPLRNAVEPLPSFETNNFNDEYFANETILIDRHHRTNDSFLSGHLNQQYNRTICSQTAQQHVSTDLHHSEKNPVHFVKPNVAQQIVANQKSMMTNETDAERMKNKRLQVRRVMEILRSSSTGQHRRSTALLPTKRSAGGCSLLYPMRKDVRKSSTVDEVWVQAATECAHELPPQMSVLSSSSSSSTYSSTSDQSLRSKAPETKMLQERQKKLQLQLKALVNECSSLTPTLSKSNYTNQITDNKLFNDCTRGNSLKDAFKICSSQINNNQQLNGNKHDGGGDEENSSNTSPLPLSADSGIMNSNEEERVSNGSSSASSSPMLNVEEEAIVDSSYSLADRIECLRNELQTVVKVAIEQIRQSQ